MIRLRLRVPPPVRLDLSALVPDRLQDRSTAEIEHLELRVGNRIERVGDWFAVAGAEADHLVFEDPCERLDRIGAGMKSGRITVAGDCGADLGLGLAGGVLDVDGDCGFGAATAMRGGTLTITGNAGDALGGAVPGERGGMRGGTVIVSGAAGERAGDRMRRGLIVIGGDAGGACGCRMIAGTVLVAGRVGDDPGFAMRRGTVIALGGAARIGVGFDDSGVHDLVWLRLLAAELTRRRIDVDPARLQSLRRFAGDQAAGGKGEILVPA